MPHYRSMFSPNDANKDYLFAFELLGKEHHLVIEKVTQGELSGEKGRKSKKPVLWFKGAKKRLALNKTNAKTVAQMYGVETSAWVGKTVTLYPTVTEYNGETLECIRIRNVAPKQAVSGEALNDVPPPSNAMTDEERAEILSKETAQ